MIIRLSGPDAAQTASIFASGLPDREFHLGRYLVADIDLKHSEQDEDGVRLTIEALTIDND